MININEFHKYLEIDRQNLDEELIRQASLFWEVGEAYAYAAAERDGAKEALSVTDAELDTQIRASHEKVTEAAIKSLIQATPKHIAACDAYLDAKYKADQLGALKEAFNQRSYMLKELCGLYATNYFETNAVRGNTKTDDVVYEGRRKRLAAQRQKV